MQGERSTTSSTAEQRAARVITGLSVQLANGFTSRLRGLMFRRSLPQGQALLITRCSSVHSACMRFAIDVVYLDCDGKVMRCVSRFQPWRASVGGRGAKHALELPAGDIERLDIRVGDRLAHSFFEPKLRPVTPKHLRGSAMVEFVIIAPIMTFIGLAILQYGLLFNARNQIQYAAFMAARAGSTAHANIDTIKSAYTRNLIALYGGGTNAGELTASLGRAATDVAAFSEVRLLNPTKESYDDWNDSGLEQKYGSRAVPNGGQAGRDLTVVGGASGQNLQDANLIKVKVTHGYELKVPIVRTVYQKYLTWMDPGTDKVQTAMIAAGRVPITTQATLQMQSDAIEGSATISSPGRGNGSPTDPGDTSGPAKPAPNCVTMGCSVTNPNPVPITPWNPPPTPPVTPPIKPPVTPPIKPPVTPPIKPPAPPASSVPIPVPPASAASTPTQPTTPDGPECKNKKGDGGLIDSTGRYLFESLLGTTAGDQAWDFMRGLADGLIGQITDMVDLVKQIGNANVDDLKKGLTQLITAMKSDPIGTLKKLAIAVGKPYIDDAKRVLGCGAYDIGNVAGAYINPATLIKVASRLGKYGGKIEDAIVAVNKGCSSFAAGTPVLTPNGSRPIESLRVGDIVRSRDENTFVDTPRAITKTIDRTAPDYYRLTTEFEELRLTEEHPLWSQGKGWVETRTLQRGDIVATATGDVTVLDNEHVDEPLQVYNFSVDSTPSYFVGRGVWVHNAGVVCALTNLASKAWKDLTSLERGFRGEVAVFDDLTARGFKPVGGSFDPSKYKTQEEAYKAWVGQTGIDGIYKGEDGKFIIVESKATGGTKRGNPNNCVANLCTLVGGERQMSDEWINKNLAKTVTSPTELKEIQDALKNKQVTKVYAQTDATGTIFNKIIDVNVTDVRIGGVWKP